VEAAIEDVIDYHDAIEGGIKAGREEAELKLKKMRDRYLEKNAMRQRKPIWGMFTQKQLDNMNMQETLISTSHALGAQVAELAAFRGRIEALTSAKDAAEQQRVTAERTEGDEFDAAMAERQAAKEQATGIEKELNTASQNTALAKLETFLRCIFLTQRRPAEQLLVYAVNDPLGRFSSPVAHFMVPNTLTGRDMNCITQYVIWMLDTGAVAKDPQKPIDVVAVASDGASQMVWGQNYSGKMGGDPHSLLHLAQTSLEAAKAVVTAAKAEVGIQASRSGDHRQKTLTKSIMAEKEMELIQENRDLPPPTPTLGVLHAKALLQPGSRSTPERQALAELFVNANETALKKHKRGQPSGHPRDFQKAHEICTTPREEGGLGMVTPSAGQVTQAWRSQRAVSDPSVSVNTSMQRLATAKMDHDRIEMKRRKLNPVELGEKFNDPQPTGNHTRAYFQDELHKAKCARRQVLAQVCHELNSEVTMGLALSRTAILSTCDKRQEELKWIRRALLHPDPMDTGVCEYLFRNEQLREYLVEDGHHKEAAVLRILGGGFEAFEQEGLDVETRIQLVKERSDLITSLFGNRLFDPAMAKDSKVAGFSRQVMYAWKTNGDCLDSIMDRYPDTNFCQQMLSSNELENLFSLTIGHARQGGYHPGGEQMARLMQTVCRKQELIRNPNVGITVPVSNSRSYPQRFVIRNADWNSGSLIGESEEARAKREKVRDNMQKDVERRTRNRKSPREGAKAKAGLGIRG